MLGLSPHQTEGPVAQILPMPEILKRVLDYPCAVGVPQPRCGVVTPAWSPSPPKMQQLLGNSPSIKQSLGCGGRLATITPLGVSSTDDVAFSCTAVATVAVEKGSAASPAPRRWCATWTAATPPAAVFAVVSKSSAAGRAEVEHFRGWLASCWQLVII